MKRVDPNDESTFKTCVIRSALRLLTIPKRLIARELDTNQCCHEDAFAIKLALEEALSNAVKHGNQGDSSKKVMIRWAITADRVVIIVRDEGPGFEPTQVPDPTSPDRLPVPNGRGIMLMRAYMDEVRYRDHGKEVYFAKCCRNKKS